MVFLNDPGESQDFITQCDTLLGFRIFRLPTGRKKIQSSIWNRQQYCIIA
jgi:hypothetical protein